ncbi:uncharacterized protein NECHADRAFT_85154 [Fusarium vanettenii 77-13-4]|uniref:Uncharacterized protein n=1 Tax=Fusarium vanettenii (strain ATCC MYA-4622 / CBS 123669 / FGSC 9596 / NRRL 45880 / 77-13-4) TaxID=660122 RepID=C7YV52_FUSV7|nr:uncharacterized protein NECHADRAFT_85154 [Fusarium vanettenii 77-13-4]EEU44924.1 predicted protein [Fusarium vanettenii 77-13-4]
MSLVSIVVLVRPVRRLLVVRPGRRPSPLARLVRSPLHGRPSWIPLLVRFTDFHGSPDELANPLAASSKMDHVSNERLLGAHKDSNTQASCQYYDAGLIDITAACWLPVNQFVPVLPAHERSVAVIDQEQQSLR